MLSGQIDSSASCFTTDKLNPLVSVIIRSMGRPTLRQAMDSLATQHYPHLELVVVNARGPGHPSLPDQYGHIPIRFCDDGQSLRRSRAANRGMEQAQGTYLLFLDDDDWLLPDHISALVAALQRQPHLRVAYAGVDCIREEPDGRRYSVLLYNQPFDALRLLYENYIPMHAVLFERQFYIEGCRFDENLDIYEDWDFWLQLRAAGPFIHVNQISAVYRLNAMENLGGAAQKGLHVHAWDALIHKWRHHWSDYELRAICTQAKLQQQYHQQLETVRAECSVLLTEREKQTAFVERQARLVERQARQEIAEFLEQEQARHRETVSALHQSIETLAGKIAQQQREVAAVTAGLAAIESSTIWRASYPYRWLMIRLRARWQRLVKSPLSDLPDGVLSDIPCPPTPHLVDVIIPVYRGLVETQNCINSVLATVPDDLGEIVVINDASPEPELVAWLDELAEQNPWLTLLHNPENLGFVQTCNRGMALHPERDLVLLNSDTEVANDWLMRLRECAYRDRCIGTVTPFSNNATICSYPRFCADNALPHGWTTEQLDALFSRCNRGNLTDIPTAIGFCMYVRRDCLRETGDFDERHFGKGYGEENDFSMRAKALGWRHVLCAEVFVYHAGSVSFADHQNHQKRQAMTVLNRLHPDYEPLVHRHIAQDPARPFRLRVDLARLAQCKLPIVLLITHDRGGGTQRHIEELAELFTDTLQFLLLRPGGNGQYLLSWSRPGEALQLLFDLPNDTETLLEFLQALPVQRVHFHHTLGLNILLLELPERLRVPYDFTLHDYYACCPQISLTDYRNHYCGEPDDAGCNRCLAILPAPGGQDIQTWRQSYRTFVMQAARVLAPSRDAVERLTHYFPDANVLFAPHPDLDGHVCPTPQPSPALSSDTPLRIAVLGALSPIKGADILEQCASDAYQRGLPLTFQLFGYAYRDLRRPPRDFLWIHGPYDEADLPDLLAKAQPHLVWFPAQWPETYSYTLSVCLQLGLPVVVPDLGAFPERVAGRAWSWIRPWRQTSRDWNDFFIKIREKNFIVAHSPPPPPPPTSVGMALGSFEYPRDYRTIDASTLRALDGAATDRIMATVARTFAYPRMTNAARRRATIKLGLLDIVVRLRRAPMLRWIARGIPLGWQTRAKTWLRSG